MSQKCYSNNMFGLSGPLVVKNRAYVITLICISGIAVFSGCDPVNSSSVETTGAFSKGTLLGEGLSNLKFGASAFNYTRNSPITNATPTVSGPVKSFSVTPDLPKGLSLNASNGVISGTPTVNQDAISYKVSAKNSVGTVSTDIKIAIGDAPANLVYSSKAVYTVGVQISANVPSNSGGSPTSFKVSPSLPSGLALDSTLGIITGTPTVESLSSSYTITASNVFGSTTLALSVAVYVPYQLLVSGPSSSYNGRTFSSSPTVTFVRASDNSVYTTIQDSASLTAYSDSSCTTASTGTLTSSASSTVSGVATFTGVSFSPSPSWKEGNLYLKATGASQSVSKCFSAISMSNPTFGFGRKSAPISSAVGFVTGGAPGDAGGDTNQEVDSITKINLDSQGRIVGTGRSRVSPTISAISFRRILPTGQIDTSFGTGTSGVASGQGYTVPTLAKGASGRAASSMTDMAWGNAIDSLDRTVAVGTTATTNGYSSFAAWRVTSTGALDTSFANGTSSYAGSIWGGTTGAAGGLDGSTMSENPRVVLVDSQGRYIVIGNSRSNTLSAYSSPNDYMIKIALWRINPDGTLDSTFPSGAGSTAGSYSGTAVWNATSPAGGTWAGNKKYLDTANGGIIDSHGRIVVVGQSVGPATNAYEMALWRFTSDGAPDTTFVDADTPYVSGGVHWNNPGVAGVTGGDAPMALAEDSQGRYVVAGYSSNGTGYEVALWRYNSDGSRDTTFPAAGLGSTSNKLGSVHLGTVNAMGVSDSTASLYNRVMAISIDSSGKYVLYGGSKIVGCGGGFRVAVWRVNTDGTLDSTFGASGSGALSYSSGVITANGSDGNGGVGVNYGAAGQTCASNNMYDISWTGLIDSFGRIVAGGWSANTYGNGATGWEWAVWRFKSNGAEDK